MVKMIWYFIMLVIIFLIKCIRLRCVNACVNLGVHPSDKYDVEEECKTLTRDQADFRIGRKGRMNLF